MKQDNGVHTPFLTLLVTDPPPCTEVDGETFYPDEADRLGIALARGVCRQCPIVNQCLEWAIQTDDQHAILGGTTPQERRALKRRRAA